MDFDGTLGLNYTNPENGCSLYVGLICDDNRSDGNYSVSTLMKMDGVGDCTFNTTLTADFVCPVFNTNSLVEWIQDNKWLFGSILIVVGFFLGLFGQRLFSITLFIVGTLATVFLIWILFYSTFLSSSTEDWVSWVVLSGAIIVGLLAGFVLYKCQRLGAAIIGGWGGWIAGAVFCTAVLWAASSEVAFWIISVSFALIAAALAFCFYYHAVILSTAFAGSYMFVRGISLFAGGFPNMITLIQELESGAAVHIEWWFYLYLVFIVLLFILCTIFQYKHFKKGVEEGTYDSNGHPKHPYDKDEDEKKCCC